MKSMILIGWIATMATAAGVDYSDALASLPASWSTAGDWTVLNGPFEPAVDGLVAGPQEALGVLGAVPLMQAGKASVTVVPQRRVRPDGWAVAALLLYEGPRRLWQLALVADPDGTSHRTELLEAVGNVWQAQSQPGTALEGSVTGTERWEYGQPYRLQIEWSPSGIVGRVRPADMAEWSWTRTYRFVADVEAVKQGRPALKADGVVAQFSELEVAGEPADGFRLGGDRALLLDGLGPWQTAEWKQSAEQFAALLKEAGREAEAVTPEALVEALADPQVGLIAVPDLAVLPRATAEALASFVAAGGDLLATGHEPFREVLYESGGQWVNRATLLAGVKPREVFLIPARARGLQRSTNQTQPAPRMTFGARGPEGDETALEVQIEKLSGWDTLSTPPFESSPFAAGDTLTVFSLKGTPGQAITVEWKEQDGSRWIASVPLAADWRQVALSPGDFRFWADGSPASRAATVFQPSQARILQFGPASGFGAVVPGPVTYAIGPLGVAPSPITVADFEPPVIETISPWYKQYETKRGKATVRVPVGRPRGLTAWPELDGRYEVIGPLLKPDATRWQTAAGAAVYWLPTAELPDPAKAALVSYLKRDLSGLTLLNGGPERLVHRPGAAPALAARVLNRSTTAVDAVVRFEVIKGKETVATQDLPLPLAPGATRGVVATGPALAAGEYQVKVAVMVGEAVADTVAAPLRVLPKATADSRRVTIGDGVFQVGGQRVFLHGTNYWPGYVSGSERNRYWGHWLTPRNYDPDWVEADLAAMEKLGINLVSIQYTSPVQGPPLVDFLERCARHKVWANIYLGGAHPLGFSMAGDEGLLQAAELAGNTTVFAYDLAWEPRLGDHQERTRFDASWRLWIDEQYGSLAVAEQAWGMPAPRNADGEATNPDDAQVLEDGSHRIMVAAYRRFADDLISRGYRAVTQYLRSLDPDALLGARTGYGGTGQKWPNRVMAYDMVSGAAWLDFTSPEGYGLPPTFEEGRSTGFITAYGRWAGNGAPVFWSEFGSSLGPAGGTPETRSRQVGIWRTMLQVIVDSRADASAGWWWPGGWRVDERSDYGVTEPDGTPREALKVGTELAKQYAAEQGAETAEPVTIAIDRDADARGTHGLWEVHGAAYVAAREQDRPVRLATRGDGTTTATMPRVQIGNVPYQGSGPLKYANAEIAGLTVVWDGGQAESVNGATVEVPAGRACRVTIRLMNTAEATWVASGGEGGVSVALDGLPAAALSRDVPRYREAVCEAVEVPAFDGQRRLTGRAAVAGLGPFGERLSLTLQAAD